ncbi:MULTISPECIES: choice-of-anchor A family protein [unclassified Pseudoalteromonas]|uniref:choice-of-anchor A family protein n=1 Tax=unclassified Pseudoalteromonas TaxID=194690 RepID=UPI000C0D51AA|nr:MULTISPECIES: choice-of-anchor A family protein [unclassified Pseudoalteromonas]MDN3412815.1 choice-of-anchor A family protein [Pseudoalteromonas sp. APC 3250]PHQ93832.1 MAG: hemolysin [Pseudoalteromonas sp.]TMS60670.1 hemolysin [Pseudoalteromonas sp. S3173]
MTNSLLKFKKISAVIALTLASSTTLAADLGVANNFSAFVFNDFKSNFGRADGAIAAGEIDLKGYSVGYTRPYSPEEYYLISESTIDFKYGRQYVGSMIAGGGTDIHWGVRWGMEWGSKILSNQDQSAMPFNFDEQEQYYKDLSTQLSELDETGIVYRKWGGLYLQGDGSSDTQVFNLDARDFAKAHTFKVWGIPADATIIFNITGDDNVVVKGKSFARLRHHASKTVFNFTNAQKLDIKGNRWQGVILAPYADIRGVYGTAKMPIIGQSFYGSMALLGGEFDGNLPSTVAPVCNEINIVDKWNWTASEYEPTYVDVISTPLAAQLNDDNGDGLINELDVVDIIAVTFDSVQFKKRGIVRALSGVDGSELWLTKAQDGSVSYNHVNTHQYYSIAVADLDNDGLVDIFAYDSVNKTLNIYSNEGLLKKSIPQQVEGLLYGSTTIADLDADGYPEILFGKVIWDLYDDSVTALQIPSSHSFLRVVESTVVDVDLDGVQEILANGILYNQYGEVIWSKGTDNGETFALPVNFDNDAYPEIVQTDLDGTISLYDHEGNKLWSVKAASEGAGVSSLADINGDGIPEIINAGYNEVRVINSNGAILSTTPMNDISSMRVGTVAYDFNNDGKSEVIYQDEEKLEVFDFNLNQVIYSTTQSSGTLREYPIVVDLDGDGSGEIISGSNRLLLGNKQPTNGVHVKTTGSCKWAPATRIWNQHSYSGANINQNGSLPLQQENSWEKSNTFRSANLK